MRFGFDVFARVEFAKTDWHNFKNWIEICDHSDIEWEIIERDENEWTKMCAPNVNQWTKIDIEQGTWDKVAGSTDNPWIKTSLPKNDITRC